MQTLYDIVFWPLLIAPWASIPICGYLTHRDRFVWALFAAMFLCFGLWFVHFEFVSYLEGGSIIDRGPAFVLHLLLDYAVTAFGVCIVVMCAIWMWRRWQMSNGQGKV